MKKTLIPLAILCCTLTSAFAQDGRRNDNRDRGSDRMDIKECLIKNDDLRQENRSLLNKLTNCNGDQVDRERLDRVLRENDDLTLSNQNLLAQVEQLKIDNARLDMEAHPERGGFFNLAASILSCGKIKDSLYAQQCTAAAKANSIQASVIDQCARFRDTYYALECVKAAGTKPTNARQVEACLQINDSLYAVQCVQIAGQKNINAEVINSCTKTTSDTFYQLQCVKNM